ncbi:MAG: YifB family Mg chelatase-like AAA ATPase [Gammaproteobacteria bacterium]|nr:YifB family Mg chelatase-like AAA ATPase [Gammaproteobacteria bacterium]
MSLATLYSRAQAGINAPLVTVEVHLANGLPALSIVGLPETAVKESKDRVRGALLNSQFEFPARRITINLAPADLPKDGGRYDLAIALGILAASGQIPSQQLGDYEFIGELALSGELRPVRGVLPVSMQARASGRTLMVPIENTNEAALVEEATVLGARHLLDVCGHLHGNNRLKPHVYINNGAIEGDYPNLSDIRGQHHAKRALEISAAGGHSLLMIGPPGTGKSMLASRLPGILPRMSKEEALESAAINSISHNGFVPATLNQRPFRTPHHTASGVALVGGGSQPRPGEISLSHNGVMFLDELPEFDRRVLEVLREPLESGKIVISRAARQAEFPARFQLIAAMNPCPCGYLGDKNGRCQCSHEQIRRYRARLSGPLLDRIDMHIEVPAVPFDELKTPPDRSEDLSRQARERVQTARDYQLARCGKANHAMGIREIESSCQLSTESARLLEQASQQLGLSARVYHRILKVARTIADLAAVDEITTQHISEAISYRRLDRRIS